MPTPIWNDPHFAPFFRGVEQTIVESKRDRAPLRDERLHELLCALYSDERAAHHAQAAA